MSVATKPSPLVVEAPKGSAARALRLWQPAPRHPWSRRSPPSLSRRRRKAGIRKGHERHEGERPLRRRTATARTTASPRTASWRRSSPTLVEFTSSAKQSPLILAERPAEDRRAEDRPASQRRRKRRSRCPPPRPPSPSRPRSLPVEIATREISTRAERAEEKAEAKHLPESKKDPGASGKSAQVSSEVAERFFEEGARSERRT